MGSTFYAFPLHGKGESFLLRTTNAAEPRSIVVDAGYAGEGPHSLFGVITREASDLKTIDRLICTHEDADHCGGMPGFIRAWLQSKRKIGQLWLPAIWSVGAARRTRSGWDTSKIVRGAFEVAPAIAAKLRDMREELTATGLDNVHPITVVRRAAEDIARESASLDELLGKSIENGDTIVPEGRCPSGGVWGADRWRSEKPLTDYDYGLAMMLADDALKTHRRIAPIIAEAIHWNIPIRWFDFGRFRTNKVARGGDIGFLTPVNAVEVAGTRGPVGAAVAFLALILSRANAESLVFLRHAETSEPPVIFTADSRLAFGTSSVGTNFPKPLSGLPVDRKLLATAFHHASSSNIHGYGVLKGWLGTAASVLYVRNGGAHVKNIATDFLHSDRMCVCCHRSKDPARLIRICAPAGEWQVPTHYVPCICA